MSPKPSSIRAALRTLCAGALLGAAALAAQATAVNVTPLVSDDTSVHPALIEDPNLVNAWGISMSATGPFWVSNNGTGTSTLYAVNPSTGAPSKQALTVSIPGAGNVTGQAFNGGTGFNSDRFLFVSEDGTISGWRGALGTTAEVLQTASPGAVYKGVAFGSTGGNSYLYATNFRSGQIDVLAGNGGAPALSGHFTDPNLPTGYAPFNIQNLGGVLYVTYAFQDATKTDEVAGAGMGFVDSFDLNGNLIARVATQGTLDAPWAVAIAPGNFGAMAGALLVGNFGDGTISAYDRTTSQFIGQLLDAQNNVLAIDGLWALTPGNGGSGGSPDALYFTAGPDGERHGLFGVLTPLPEPGSLALALLGLAAAVGTGARRGRHARRGCHRAPA